MVAFQQCTAVLWDNTGFCFPCPANSRNFGLKSGHSSSWLTYRYICASWWRHIMGCVQVLLRWLLRSLHNVFFSRSCFVRCGQGHHVTSVMEGLCSQCLPALRVHAKVMVIGAYAKEVAGVCSMLILLFKNSLQYPGLISLMQTTETQDIP